MNSFNLTDINFYAVFIAWIIHILTGLLWFQPRLFGNSWSRLTGKELKPSKKWIIAGLAGHLAMVMVLVVIIKLVLVNSGAGGLLIGLMGWIGFIVPIETGELIWERIPFRLFLIRIGNQFLGLGISGYLLGAWQ